MIEGQCFSDFELSGWEDEATAIEEDRHLSLVTTRAVDALLDDAHLRSGQAMRDLAASVGYVAAAAAPDKLFAMVAAGTVRAAATLRAQSPQAREAIRNSARQAMSAYRTGTEFEVPMPAVVVAAVKLN